jgi:hypothetical protein
MSLQNTAGVSKTDTPVTPHRPLQFKLKREIILVLLFKLVLLFSIKAAFFHNVCQQMQRRTVWRSACCQQLKISKAEQAISTEMKQMQRKSNDFRIFGGFVAATVRCHRLIPFFICPPDAGFVLVTRHYGDRLCDDGQNNLS